MEQISNQLTSTHTILRACMGWVFELGISPEMPFYLQKNLVLINCLCFISMLLSFPGTFMLILIGFEHPFSLLISVVLLACLILGLNGAKQVEWSKGLFAFAPPIILVIYTLLDLSANGPGHPFTYLLERQGLCFALLIPVLIYGVDQRQKVAIVVGICLVTFLGFDVGSMQLGAFSTEKIIGVSHGLFSILSLLQYVGLVSCVLYMQNYYQQHTAMTQQSNEKLKSLAIRDGLTGLFNHTYMQEQIGDAINRSKRSMNPFSLLMIDVDYFKGTNDTLGHNAGDEVLVELTRCLCDNKRSTDYLGRWGGDELILLLTDTNLTGAQIMAEKLRRVVETHAFPNQGHQTISLGASEYQDGDDPASLIARADSALYQAKRSGRNRVSVQGNGGL